MKAAVLSFQEETGLSRSTIFEAHKLDSKALVLSIETLLGSRHSGGAKDHIIGFVQSRVPPYVLILVGLVS